MPIEIFDTDFISEYLRGSQVAIERFKRTPREHRFTTIVNEAELVGPRYRQLMTASDELELARAQMRLNVLRDLLANSFAGVLQTDLVSSRVFAELKQIAKLRRVDHTDLIIAAIAIRYRAILVTGNVDHFRKVPRLRAQDFRPA